jgi:hypothetical protein
LSAADITAILSRLDDADKWRAYQWLTRELNGFGAEGLRSAPQPLLRVPQVMAELQYSKSRVYELIRSGELPCVRDKDRHGRDKRGIRVTREALDEFKRIREMRGPVSMALNNMLSSSHDRSDTETPAPETRTHSNRARSQAGSPLCDRGPVGDRGGEDSESGGDGG